MRRPERASFFGVYRNGAEWTGKAGEDGTEA